MNKLILVLIVLMLSSSVYALGITPGRTTIDFSPGLEQEVTVTVINSDAKNSDFIVLVQGELNQSISVSNVSFSMLSSDPDMKLHYNIKLPQSLSPGLHSGEVVVVRLPDKLPGSDTFVGAALGVSTQVQVFVPYPGKYAEATMNAVGEGPITFVLPVASRGEQNLAKVRAVIDIYTALNEKVATINTNELDIPSGERKELAASWDANFPPGNYLAVATLLYDEQTARIEKQFSIGQQSLDLQTIEVNDFSLGEIAKFEMLVESKWSQPINGAYANMIVYNDEGEVIADFKSPSYDIPALGKVLMVSFWDTAGINKGKYASSLFIRYGEKSVQKDLSLEVSDNKITIVGLGYVISSSSTKSGNNSIVVILATGIGVLVLVNLLWFIFLRKKLSKKR